MSQSINLFKNRSPFGSQIVKLYLIFLTPLLVRTHKYPLRLNAPLQRRLYKNRILKRRDLGLRLLPLHSLLPRSRLLIFRILLLLYFLLSLLLRCLFLLCRLRLRLLILLRRLLVLRRRLRTLLLTFLRRLLLYPRFRRIILLHFRRNLTLTLPLRIFTRHLRLPYRTRKARLYLTTFLHLRFILILSRLLVDIHLPRRRTNILPLPHLNDK